MASSASETMTQVGVNLPPALVSRIDTLGAQLGLSRSAVVRMLVTSALESNQPAEGVWPSEAN
jgi:metal-responsive CopG/Arc/MetJ family transcriptional regulator